jgi:hypothetical protein
MSATKKPGSRTTRWGFEIKSITVENRTGQAEVSLRACSRVPFLVIEEVFSRHGIGPGEAYVAVKVLQDFFENVRGIHLGGWRDREAVLMSAVNLGRELKALGRGLKGETGRQKRRSREGDLDQMYG